MMPSSSSLFQCLTLALLVASLSSSSSSEVTGSQPDDTGRRLIKKANARLLGVQGLCVIGCTPYVDFADANSEATNGYAKYKALVNELVNACDVIVHVGDPKPAEMPCNSSLLTKPLHHLRKKARSKSKLVLFAPGDNEINDCHRHGSTGTPSDFLKARDARNFLITDLNLLSGFDLTGRYKIASHNESSPAGKAIPGSNGLHRYRCDFDKYVEVDGFAVATLEIPGAHWYLHDERSKYTSQNSVDPLSDRIWMYLNAKDCALAWIDESAKRASDSGKRAIFFHFHAVFYTNFGTMALSNSGIGAYYDTDNLQYITKLYTGEAISLPYQPLFDKLTQVGLKYPDLMIYVVHSDGHRLSSGRLNPTLNNNDEKLYSNHNVMVHQVEGDSRALTMYSRFTVNPSQFQPVTFQERWSRQSYLTEPLGHSRVPY